jgi:hypothetical protein
VDIVQATGRAMRRSPGKTTGYVLVPLYVELSAGECAKRRGVRRCSGALGGRDAENGNRDGRAPQQSPIGGRAQAPANGGLGWTNGAKGAESRSDGR